MKRTLIHWRGRIRERRMLNTTWRIGVFTVGVSVVAGGVLMLLLPGPGWAAIFVGFAILATEFAWAQNALAAAKNTAQRAKEKALDPRVRRRNQILAVLTGIIVAAAIVTYISFFGLRLPWRPW